MPSKLDQLKAMTTVVADTGDMDAMATEKLAEGIRVFARDLRALREQVSKRLQEAA